MKLFHKIKINISGTPGDGSTTVLKGGEARLLGKPVKYHDVKELKL